MSRLLKDKTYKHILKRAIDIDDIDEYFNSNLWKEFKTIYFDPKNPIAEDDAKEFYYQHEKEMQYPVLWEDKYDCLDLALEYYSNPSAFKQEMQNDASKLGEKAFHALTTKPSKEIEEQDFARTILCCDPAVEINKNNDYSAFIVGSKSYNNFRWVRKGIIQKVKFDDYINKVIELLKEYPEISHIWIEKNTYNGTDAREIKLRISAEPALLHRDITILNERQFKNKEAKIRAISGKVDSGFIIFNEDDVDFNAQVLAYEGEGFTSHDDAPDILAEFDRIIDEVQTIGKIEIKPNYFL